MGITRVSVPHAWLLDREGNSSEWYSKALGRYQHLTKRAEVLTVSVYIAGTTRGR